MKKKRQADFQKQKLRVGKTLPKGANVTNTSFKAKKIITRDYSKHPGGTKSLKEMLTNLVCSKAVQKVESLHTMKKYVIENRDSLPLYFSDVLKKVGSILLEDNKQVRALALEVLNTCLDLLTEQQFKTFFTSVSTHLHCMMTHLNFGLKQDSLKLLDILLHTHPNVICGSSKVLNCLLNLISWMDNGEKGKKKKRKLMDLMRNNMAGNEWRLEVLVRVLMFLQALGKKQEVNEEEEDREVYWDRKSPLTVPLYLNSGPKPAKLVYPSRVDTTMDFIDYRDFKAFLKEVVPLLSQALRGEVPESEVSASEGFHIFDSYVINHLNIIAQILCCIGETINKTSNLGEDMDPDFSLEIRDIISDQLLRNFPYAQHDEKASPSTKKEQGKKKSDPECMQLNLAVCYLYSTLFLEPAKNGPHQVDSQNAAMESGKPVLRYVGNVFGASTRLCPKSLSLLLKACKNLMKSNISKSYKNGILLGMYDILEDRKFSSSAKLLNSFFMDLSLNFDFKYLLNTEGMSTWFKLLIKELGIMKESNAVDKTFLKYVSQVCARRYSPFMELLNELQPVKLLEYLKYDNEEFQLTIAHLIVALDAIPPDFLQDLAETMRQDSFSSKTAVRLINLLHARYSRSNVSEVDQIYFVKFLLNLGCDTLSIGEQLPEEYALSYDLADIQQALQYEIFPSRKWERHCPIFQACVENLVFYSEKERIAECIIQFMKSVMLHCSKLYIHSALAFLELRKRISYCYQDEHLPSMFHELILSSLVYISVVVNEATEEELGLYSVLELQNSLTASLPEAPEIIAIIENNIYNFNENDMYHILRVIMFLIQKKILGIRERNALYVVLDKMSSACTLSKMLNPMWTTICTLCGFL